MHFFFLFLIIFSISANAAQDKNRVPNVKWDFETYDQQKKMLLEFPYGKTIKNAFWVSYSRPAPQSYRYLYPMLAAAFYSDRADQRRMAISWLEKYQCENFFACQNYFNKLDFLIKDSVLTMSKRYKNRYTKIRESVETRLNSMTAIVGFCAPEVDREKVVEDIYQIHCPHFETSATLDPRVLEAEIAQGTKQVALSSSRILNFEQSEANTCQSKWTAKITCEIAGKTKIYSWNCEKKSSGLPNNVECVNAE